MSKNLRVLEGATACGNYLEVKWLTGSWGWSLLGRRTGGTVGLLRNQHDRRWAMGRRGHFPHRWTGGLQKSRLSGQGKDGVSGPGQHSVSCSVPSGLMISLDPSLQRIYCISCWFHRHATSGALFTSLSSKGQCDSPNSDLFLLL